MTLIGNETELQFRDRVLMILISMLDSSMQGDQIACQRLAKALDAGDTVSLHRWCQLAYSRAQSEGGR